MAFSAGKLLTKVFGSRNERLLKRYRRFVEQINALEPEISQRTDSQLRARTAELREGVRSGKIRSADILAEAFAIVRESMDRNIGIRQVFNPEEDPLHKFDPNKLDDAMLAKYDDVQRKMIATGEVPWR